MGKLTVKLADSYAGLGCWKKRMLCCNDADISLNVTEHESEPTSNGSLIAREFGEPTVWRKANDSNDLLIN